VGLPLTISDSVGSVTPIRCATQAIVLPRSAMAPLMFNAIFVSCLVYGYKGNTNRILKWDRNKNEKMKK
jgi:hypothetical protein